MKEVVQFTIPREDLELILGTMTVYMAGCRGDLELYMGTAKCLMTLFEEEAVLAAFNRLHDVYTKVNATIAANRTVS